MTDSPRFGSEETICPKRLWVMTILADDEALGRGEPLPRGLAFHLSRCESCQALADQLGMVSANLQAMSDGEPSQELARRAEAQARAALDGGAKLTGRVTIPDEPEEPASPSLMAGWVVRYRYAAAAAIVLAIGLWQAPRLLRQEAATTLPVGPGVVADDTDAPVVLPSEAASFKDIHLADQAISAEQPPVGDQIEQPSSPLLDDLPLDDGSRVTEAEYPIRGPALSASPKRRASRRICRHKSAIEAAMCDNIHDVHTAFVPPRALSGSNPNRNRAKLIDRTPPPDSTNPGSGGD